MQGQNTDCCSDCKNILTGSNCINSNISMRENNTLAAACRTGSVYNSRYIVIVNFIINK